MRVTAALMYGGVEPQAETAVANFHCLRRGTSGRNLTGLADFTAEVVRHREDAKLVGIAIGQTAERTASLRPSRRDNSPAQTAAGIAEPGSTLRVCAVRVTVPHPYVSPSKLLAIASLQRRTYYVRHLFGIWRDCSLGFAALTNPWRRNTTIFAAQFMASSA